MLKRYGSAQARALAAPLAEVTPQGGEGGKGGKGG